MTPGDPHRDACTRVAHAPDTCDAMLGEHRVVLDVRSRALHVLRPDASAIWPFLDGTATVQDLARELAVETATSIEDARRTVDQWIGPLLEAGLLELTPEPCE